MENYDLESLRIFLKRFKSTKHDLNNLLNNILNAADLLSDRFSNDKSVILLTQQIQNNSILASKVLSQILTPAKKEKETFSALNLEMILKETIKLNGAESIEYNSELSNNDTIILGNYLDLQRVFLNLIENAKDSAKINLKIKIHLKSVIIDNNNFVEITFTDNGNGINKKELNNIFDLGYTTKGSDSERGLGLSIVKDIIENHKGSINVESIIKVGTSFKIHLPMYNSNLRKIFEEKTVVLAEDDQFQREVLKDLLSSMKINVFTASNGVDALELFYNTNPDVLFIDDNMPGITGFECINKIRKNDSSSKIVLVTGSQNYEHVNNDNLFKVLNKPYNFEEVKLLLNELF